MEELYVGFFKYKCQYFNANIKNKNNIRHYKLVNADGCN